MAAETGRWPAGRIPHTKRASGTAAKRRADAAVPAAAGVTGAAGSPSGCRGRPDSTAWVRGRASRDARPRARRGDVRAAALALLAEQPMNGYQIIQEISERSGGVWRPSPGSVYPALQQLEDEGLIRAESAEGGRRAYTLTDEGRATPRPTRTSCARRGMWWRAAPAAPDRDAEPDRPARHGGVPGRQRGHRRPAAQARKCWPTPARRCTGSSPPTRTRPPRR